MRILNVIGSIDPTHGGPAEGLRQSVLATSDMGHVQEVVSLDGPTDPWVLEFPASTHALGPVRSRYGYSGCLVPWLRQHAREFDAVVVHGLWQYHSLAVWRALHGGPVPYFVYFHGMMDPWFKRRYPLKHLKKWLYWPWADYRVARDAKAVLFTAREEAVLAPRSFWLYRVKPAVVGYGMALGLQSHSTLRQAQIDAFHARCPGLRDKRILLFLARLHPKKGCDLLIEAFAQRAAADESLQLVMAGPDQVGIEAGLRRMAMRLGVADRITWTGMLQGDHKWGALHAADVFVLPSHQENFGIAVVEALAVGLPVLISQRVNIWREIVADGAGFADLDTVSGTLALLDRWLSLPTVQRLQMRTRAVQCYECHYQMGAAAQRLIDTIAPHVTNVSHDETVTT